MSRVAAVPTVQPLANSDFFQITVAFVFFCNITCELLCVTAASAAHATATSESFKLEY